MFAPFEIRRRDAEVCRQCKTKDCYRGNEQFYGCPTFEFPGGGMDSNRDCLLCTECIKACPYENITMRLRGWGRDLWARKRGKLDESVAAVILASLVTMVSLLLVLFLPKLHILMSTVLPAGTPPNDWPRVVSIGLLYLGGIATALLLMYGFSHLSRLFSGAKDTATKTFFIHFGYAVIPLGIMKFLADILDHVFRTWGAVAHRLAGRMFPERATAFRAFLPMGAFIFIMGMAALWTLSAAL
jgi:ferredoxin